MKPKINNPNKTKQGCVWMIKHSLRHTPKETQNITKITIDRDILGNDVNPRDKHQI